MKPNILELAGYIQKSDELQILENHIIQGTSVLQTSKPFYGYYADDPDEYIPQTVFFLVQDDVKQYQILRIASKISQYLEFEIDAVRAEVTVFNEVHNAIRLYDVKNYEQIELVQRAFASEGISFKHISSFTKGLCNVKIWKVFLLEEISSGIYLNKSKSKMFYFRIPEYISFSHFESVDKKVKNNWDGKSYDAAMGLFFRKHGAEEVIRVFSNHISDDMIQELPKKFLRFL